MAPVDTHTRTADQGPTRPSGAQSCLARVFVCDRPQLRPARHPLGELTRVTIGRGVEGAVSDGPGRERRLALRFADAWMSSAHVRLERALGRWVVEDEGSKNGTLVNGAPVRRAPLDDGDVLEVGQTFFLYRDAVTGLADGGGERARPLSPALEDREDFGLAVGAALRRLGDDERRILPAAARLLLAAWPVDLERCLRSALTAAGAAPIAPLHLPSPLPTPMAASGPRLVLEGELWTVTYGAATVRLKDSDGLRYLAHLVERPGVEVHVHELLTLARRGVPAAAGGPAEQIGDLGDAGPLLDAGAKAAYRSRLEDLRATVEEATRFGDLARARKAEAEIEFLVGELARAIGLGGRDRKAASAAERARVNVTLRLRHALKRLGESCPPLGQHLDGALRTGLFCCYAPVGTGQGPPSG